MKLTKWLGVAIVLAFVAYGFFYYADAATEDFRTVFEARTGIHPDSFLAAGDDCEAFHKEPCRLYGGWAPLSRFADQ